MYLNMQVQDKEVTYQGIRYTLLDSSMAYEPDSYYLFPSCHVDSEHLLVASNDELITGAIKLCIDFLRCYPHPRESVVANAQVLGKLLSFIFRIKSMPEVDRIYREKQAELPRDELLALRPGEGEGDTFASFPLTLDYWIYKRTGSCRHLNLLGFVLLGEALLAGYFPPGKVYAIRSVQRRLQFGHVVVGYQEEASQKFWLFDYTFDGFFDLSSTAGVLFALNRYTGAVTGDQKQGYANYIFDMMARFNVPMQIEQVHANLPESCCLFCFFEESDMMSQTYLQWFLAQVQAPGVSPAFQQVVRRSLAEICGGEPLYQAFCQDLDRVAQPTAKKTRFTI
jgi:hypothetical protein